MYTGKVVETQVVAQSVIHKDTKMHTVNRGDDNDIVGFFVSELGAAF